MVSNGPERPRRIAPYKINPSKTQTDSILSTSWTMTSTSETILLPSRQNAVLNLFRPGMLKVNDLRRFLLPFERERGIVTDHRPIKSSPFFRRKKREERGTRSAFFDMDISDGVYTGGQGPHHLVHIAHIHIFAHNDDDGPVDAALRRPDGGGKSMDISWIRLGG